MHYVRTMRMCFVLFLTVHTDYFRNIIMWLVSKPDTKCALYGVGTYWILNKFQSGCTNTRRQVTWRLNCVRWHLIFVGPDNGTSCHPPCTYNFEVNSKMFGEFMHPWFRWISAVMRTTGLVRIGHHCCRQLRLTGGVARTLHVQYCK